MDFQNIVPSSFIINKIKREIPEKMKIGIQYKALIKEAIVLFVYYLNTYAENIAKESGSSVITPNILNEALIELDFYEILNEILENKDKIMSKGKKVI